MIQQKQIERPFDLLAYYIGREVKVTCKAYKEYEISGKLLAFDQHKNLVLELNEEGKTKTKFLNGDNVLFIEEN